MPAGERLAAMVVCGVLTVRQAELAGVDIGGVAVGLGMTDHGHQKALRTALVRTIWHIRALRAGAPDTLCIAQRPHGSCATPGIAAASAVRPMQESGTNAATLRNGCEEGRITKAAAPAGAPVMRPVGLPHQMLRVGGVGMPGRCAGNAPCIFGTVGAIEEAGALGVEIEVLPAAAAGAVARPPGSTSSRPLRARPVPAGCVTATPDRCLPPVEAGDRASPASPRVAGCG